MAGNWIEFEQRQHGRSDDGYISLNDDGEFRMNNRLYEQFGRPGTVTLHFDPDNNLIGLRKAEAKRANAQVVRECPSNAYVVRSRAFIRKWDIRLGGTYFFPDLQIEDDMLVLPLNTRLNNSLKRRR